VIVVNYASQPSVCQSLQTTAPVVRVSCVFEREAPRSVDVVVIHLV